MSRRGAEAVGRWMASLRRWLVALALTSLAGYLCWAGTFLLYDARGGLGLLAPVGGWPILPWASFFFVFVLSPLTYAVATWRLSIRGAIVAFLGVGIVAPVLWAISPWSSVDSQARYGYYDEGRGWIGFGLLLYNVIWPLIVVPTTFMVRWGWRRLRGQRVA
jgi:hypothetical protein